MLSGRTAGDFITRVGRALEDAGRQSIRVSAGAGTCDLEMQNLRAGGTEDDVSHEGPLHLEEFVGRKDPGAPDGSSGLCYFLDGVQSTHEIGRVGTVPIVATTVAAAIVNRCDRRFSRMPFEVPPAVVRAVMLPRGVEDGADALYDLFVRAGLDDLSVDADVSSSDLVVDSAEYASGVDPSDYVGMKGLAFGRARSLRERLEVDLLRTWEGDDAALGSEGWIAVDGQLREVRESNRRAIGLIKSVARPEFRGDDVRALLDLEPGARTTSFVPGWQRGLGPSEQRVSWYLRPWPVQRGTDALGSLMRIEAHRETSVEMVDRISRWVLAERAPLAKPDPRWPAMIYPIHYVEKVLKPLVQNSERAYAKLERQLAAANERN
jgi:hypothetical protein